MFIYEPRTNTTKEMYVAEIAKLTNIGESEIVKRSFRVGFIEDINCYVSTQPFTLHQKREIQTKIKYENEYWVKMKDVTNDYYISNYGRIKRVYKSGKELMLLPQKHARRGVLRSEVVYKNVARKKWLLARLVADHFLEPKKGENYVVWHKNGNRLDDYAGNLEWIEKRALSKITGKTARQKRVVLVCKETGKILETFRSLREAAKEKNYHYTTLNSYCRGLFKNKRGELFLYEDVYKAMEDEFMEQGLEITGEDVLNYLKIFNKVRL